MLAAHETCDIDAVVAERDQRQQRQRTAFGVTCDDDEGDASFALADLTLPCGEEVETLIGSVRAVAAFQLAPDRFRIAEIGDDVERRNAARPGPVAGLRGPLVDRRSHGHSRHLSEIVYNFCPWRPSQGNVNKG